MEIAGKKYTYTEKIHLLEMERMVFTIAGMFTFILLVLFLGIAAMVYALFFKALGLFLFAVEIVWFVLKPLWSEIEAWRAQQERGA